MQSNNDADEGTYTFAIQGNGNTTNISKIISENTITVAPNPFDATAALKLVLASGANVSVEVFNSLGQRVETLVSGVLVAGEYNFNIGENQSVYPSGMYLVRTVINGQVTTTKVIRNN